MPLRRESSRSFACPRCGAGAAHIRLFVRLGGIVERLEYSCDHVDERVVGHVLPQSHFDAIERRLDRIALSEKWERARRPHRWAA